MRNTAIMRPKLINRGELVQYPHSWKKKNRTVFIFLAAAFFLVRPNEQVVELLGKSGSQCKIDWNVKTRDLWRSSESAVSRKDLAVTELLHSIDASAAKWPGLCGHFELSSKWWWLPLRSSSNLRMVYQGFWLRSNSVKGKTIAGTTLW